MRRAFLNLAPWWDEARERRRERRLELAHLSAVRTVRKTTLLNAELDRTIRSLQGRT